jgi:hypothetical protein
LHSTRKYKRARKQEIWAFLKKKIRVVEKKAKK